MLNSLEPPRQNTDRASRVKHKSVNPFTVAQGNFLSDHTAHGMTQQMVFLYSKAAEVPDDPIRISANTVNWRQIGICAEPRQVDGNHISMLLQCIATPIPLCAAPHETMNKDKGDHFR